MSPSNPDPLASPYRVARLGAVDAGRLFSDESDFLVERFDDLDSLLSHGRELQPRVCVVGPLAPDAVEPSIADTVRRIRRALPLTDVVYWVPGGDAELVRRALLSGAKDVLVGEDRERLDRRISEIVEEQTLLPRLLEEDRRGGTWRFEDLVSRSQRMWDVFETCVRTASTDASVLVLGETGTGKELIARALHRRSGRAGRFVPVNCSAVPEGLIDSELFGHVEGAFTGARKAKTGLFRHAAGGTLFLDEIGTIPVEVQNRLLRTLQEGAVRPVGGHEEEPIDVRVIAATSVPLEQEIEDGRFREDLFYRIDVIRLILPPLRERPEDLILLLGRFIHEAAVDYSVERPEIGEDFVDRVCAYAWPGNVRELENFVERIVLTHAGERLKSGHFDDLMRNYRGRTIGHAPSPELRAEAPQVDVSRPLAEVVDDATRRIEREYLEETLRAARGRIGETAARAGIHRRTLLRKLKQHGIDKMAFRA